MGIALVIYASVQIASNNTIYYYTTSEATSALDVDNSERIKLGGFVQNDSIENKGNGVTSFCLLYTSPSPRDATLSRMPSSA